MIAGTMALLSRPAADPLEDYRAAGFTTLDVRDTFGYLDDKQVQQGRVASLVDAEQEEIHIVDGSIETERIPEREQVWTEWIADVDDGGWFVAERTRGTNPTFPFETIRARTNRDVDRVQFDVPQFVRNQRDADDRNWDVWMAGRKQAADSDYEVDHTNIAYGDNATKKDAIQSEIGIGFETTWRGRVATGVLCQSGYVAIHNSSWTPEQFARFVDEELLPVAFVPETDDESEQATLEGGEEA